MPKSNRVQCKLCPARVKPKFAASHAANHMDATTVDTCKAIALAEIATEEETA